MALEYIKHSRPVNAHDMNKYGKLADHDILVPCLLLYELGKIKDKNGIEVDIDRNFINSTLQESNKWITERHSSPFASHINQWAQPINEVLSIPYIMNHKTDEVENQVGFSQGLLYTEEVNNILSLFTIARIIDNEAKKDVENGLLRAVSIGTRPSGSIKEISFVINEAAPLCGLMFSEPSFIDKLMLKKRTIEYLHLPDSGLILSPSKVDIVVENSQNIETIELSEQIEDLKFIEHELNNIIIPNHVILSRMIKTGKIYPYIYDELIKSPHKQTLELMERSLPANDLGIMFGTNKQPQKMSTKHIDNEKLETMLSEAQERLKIKKPQNIISGDIINQDIDTSPDRVKELKHILELAEFSPNIAKKYIQCELGDEVENPKYKDTLLTEYIGDLTKVRSQIKNLEIQLGEYQCQK